ncbi:MAG: sensor histidine kinase [Oscillospiraceae bacterium]|nr:sensor histidine kinase [Oscillospiraceae bacterium]
MIKLIKKLLNTNIRTKLIAMCMVVIIPVFAAGVYLIINAVGIIQNSIVNEAFGDADSLATRLKDTIYTTSTAAERIYFDEDINFILNNTSYTESDYRIYYREHPTVENYLKAFSQIVDITFYVDKENFLYNADFQRITEEIRKSYWFIDAMDYSAARWQVIKSPNDGNYYLSYVRQVYSDGGESLGVMVVYVSQGWIEELMKDEVFNIVFAVQNGMVFYSNMAEYELGKVFVSPDLELSMGVSETVELTDECPLTDKGYTIASCFDYENTGNLFQIYLVKPYSTVTGVTKDLSFGYIWYMTLCFLLSILITIFFTTYFVRRIEFLRDQMHRVTVGDFNLEGSISGDDEINELYNDLLIMVESMQKLINENYEAKIQSETFKLNQMEAEFKTLASQINPHFLYNTLETIRMKAYVNNDKETADLVKKLGKFMRRCLEVKNSMVTLESELEFTKSYLELQSARFGDRVSYTIENEVDSQYKILPLIIQPIVENAFVHGIESSKGNGVIDIKIKYSGENVIIEVRDNGQGIPDDRMSELRWKLEESDTSSGKSIGLTNVNKRIKMNHGEGYGLTFSSKVGRGTRVRITLPRDSEADFSKSEN